MPTPDNRRLLFVAPSAYPLGGVATWLDYLLPGLEQRGWKPTLGLVAGRHHDPERYLQTHPFHRVLRIENLTGSQEGRIRTLCKSISAVDPAIALSVNIPDLFLAQARLRRRGSSSTKMVMTLHGIQSDLLGDAHAFRNALDAVICTNRLTCELVRDVADVANDRIYYAPYGVDIPPAEPAVPTRAYPDRPLRIAWVGRLEEEQKRVSDIPRILRALDARDVPFQLAVVGTGPDEKQLQRELAPWLDNGKAKMWGELTREQVYRDIYRNSDVFLLTSSWETGPIVLWEAISCGLAAVTSDYLGAGPEGSLQEGKNCLMYPVGDAERSADCIARLQEPEVRSALCAQAQALVRERYTAKASIVAWSKVLDEICASPLAESPEIPLPPKGRLDRWFGVGLGETIRRAIGLKFNHHEAGGEWPHVHSGAGPKFRKWDHCAP